MILRYSGPILDIITPLRGQMLETLEDGELNETTVNAR